MHGDRGIEIISRERNLYTSSSPSEIVTVRIDGASPVQLFCKFFRRERAEADGRSASPFNEVLMYRHVLRANLSIPRLFGTYIDESAGEAWLVMDYLSTGGRLTHVVEQAAALEAAATWIGAFHLVNESRVHEPELGFLRHMDCSYFHGQLSTALARVPSKQQGLRWLARLEDNLDEVMDVLDGSAPTVVHAEFYPKNILVADARVYPIDWETASIAPGEIDLSMLLAGWPTDLIERCLAAYAEARRLQLTAAEWRRRLAAAQVLVDLHWVGFGAAPGRSRKFKDQVVPWLDALRDSCAAFGMDVAT